MREDSAVLTIPEALEMQIRHLLEWKPRLSTECLRDLGVWLIEQNARPMLTGHEVARGDDITEFVCNWRPS
jgi:hypothetical protein